MKKSGTYYFKSCKTLPIYNFYEILNTNNLGWLQKGYNDDNEEISLVKDAKSIWQGIYDEYILLLGNKVNTKGYTILAQLSEMETELIVVSELINIYSKINHKDIQAEIDKWGYDSNDLEKSLKKLEGLQFRIKITRSKNKDLLEEEEDEEVKVEYDIFKDVVSVENTLDNGILIDVHKTVVKKWVNYILIAEKKNGKRSS